MSSFSRGTAYTLTLLAFIQFVFGNELCSDQLRTKETNATVLPNGALLTSNGIQHRNGTFWQENEHWWACPCLSGACIRQCNHGMVNGSAKISIRDGDNLKHGSLSEHFKVVYNTSCPGLGGPLEEGEFEILANGSLFLLTADSNFNIVHAESYCIFPKDDNESILILCFEDDDFVDPENIPGNLKFKLYPPFFILSVIFLILTVVAISLAPDNKTFHARSVVCHSGSLSVAFIGLSIIYWTGNTSHINVCISVAYVTQYSLLASIFWLNTMCIDIYLTFNGLITKHRSHLRKFALYAWGTPLIIQILTISLDQTTSHPVFSPGVGIKRCWFASFWGDFLYFQGPIFILLTANSCLFVATARNLRRSRKESFRTLNKANSRVHLHKGQDKQRLCLYLKLSLLMGFTWLTEVISWAVGGPPEIWYFTDVVNALRGVVIFWLFVFSNKKVRGGLKDRIWRRKVDVSSSSNNWSSDQVTSASVTTTF